MDNKVTKIILILSLTGMLALSAYVVSGHKHYAANSDEAENKTIIINNGAAEKNKKSYASPTKKVKVYITGEVRKPGIYEVASGLRTSDVIELAGGFTEGAKIEGVNLTKVVRDGAQIKVPALKKNEKNKIIAIGEKKSRERSFKRPKYADGCGIDSNIQVSGFVEEVKVPLNYKICINTATFEELIVLPGIYDELARRIIAYRKHTPFIVRDDLLKVGGINQRILQKIDNYIYL